MTIALKKPGVGEGNNWVWAVVAPEVDDEGRENTQKKMGRK